MWFPAIIDYLAKVEFPASCIQDSEVTHIWTQSEELSSNIAKASLIPNVVSDINELANEVDAILLARDDWQSHMELALPLLAFGKPIFLDKPIAIDMASLEKLLNAQKYLDKYFPAQV